MSDTETPEKTESKKRSHEGTDDDDSDDGWIGPMPSEAAPQKKKKILEHEKLYLENLPCAESYEKSYMHRDAVTHCVATKTGFVITASCDGHLKFWKKSEVQIEFVKHFRAHLGNIQGLAANISGSLLISISNDKHGKVFDVVNFDMINILRLGYVPECVAWIHQASDPIAAVAIAESSTNLIHVYDGRGDRLKTLDRIHFKPVVSMAYNPVFDTAVSADVGGIIEYWSDLKDDFQFPEKKVMFTSKLDTDLFDFAKHKTYPLSLAVSPDGKLLATTSSDKKIRVFRFLSGKLYCVIDENLDNYIALQNTKQPLSTIDFNKKVSLEKELFKSDVSKFGNIIFDRTGNFLLYPSLIGVKMVNLYTNKCVKVIGKSENLRCINIALYQTDSLNLPSSVEESASENPNLHVKLSDPTLVCTAFKKNRFYLFTRRKGRDSSGSGERDVFNEKPSHEERLALTEEDKTGPRYFETAVLHTTLGDVYIKLFPRECPKTVENFCVHAKNNYFNGHIFHRVIKQFMIQTGDPTGVGTGGESIWGGEFEDELHPKLRHDRPYTVSMANAGPNTNGSQFFITVIPTPWLDNKHTVFGRVVKGIEVAQSISNVKTHPKTDKPYDDISILSVTVKDPLKL